MPDEAAVALALFSRKAPTITSEALMTALLERFGGVDGLAEAIFTEYMREGTGDRKTRVSIISNMVKLVIHLSEQQRDDDASLLSNEEIRAELQSLVEQLQPRALPHGEIIDAPTR